MASPSPLVIGLGITIVLLLLLSGYLYYTMPDPDASMITYQTAEAARIALIPTYTYHHQKAMIGPQTMQLAGTSEIKSRDLCSANPNCVAFTTMGGGYSEKKALVDYYEGRSEGIYVRDQ